MGRYAFSALFWILILSFILAVLCDRLSAKLNRKPGFIHGTDYCEARLTDRNDYLTTWLGEGDTYKTTETKYCMLYFHGMKYFMYICWGCFASDLKLLRGAHFIMDECMENFTTPDPTVFPWFREYLILWRIIIRFVIWGLFFWYIGQFYFFWWPWPVSE